MPSRFGSDLADAFERRRRLLANLTWRCHAPVDAERTVIIDRLLSGRVPLNISPSYRAQSESFVDPNPAR
jgi:hypothetical protein